MPQFTVELWRVMEDYADIGLSEYPIWDAAYRPTLNRKITDHYNNREIGMETVDMFRFALKRRMNEIMPLYNDLYRTTQFNFDPMKTVDMTTTTENESGVTATTEAGSESTTESTSASRAVNSNTPQTMLSGQGDYATSAADSNSQGGGKATGAEQSTAETAEQSSAETRMFGYQGNPTALMVEYRRSLMNIDMMIIDELNDLFMGVWDNNIGDLPPYDFHPLPNL